MYSRANTNRGFTIVELMIVVAIIGLLMALLLPALSSALRNSRAAHDKVVLKGVGSATVNSAEDYDGRFIQPSLVARLDYWHRGKNFGYVAGKGPEGRPWNSTESLYSVLCMKDYLMPEALVSPVDNNPFLLAMGEDGSETYDYNAWAPGDADVDVADEPTGFWDTNFSCQLDDQHDDNGSYANQTLAGRRGDKKWRSGSTTIIPLYATRFTADSADSGTFATSLATPYTQGDGGLFNTEADGHKFSRVLEQLGPTNQWQGHVFNSDGRVDTAENPFRYKHYAGSSSGSEAIQKPLPDNMYECEFLEWSPELGIDGPHGYGSSDNFLTFTHNDNAEQDWSSNSKFCIASGSTPTEWRWMNDSLWLKEHLTFDYQEE